MSKVSSRNKYTRGTHSAARTAPRIFVSKYGYLVSFGQSAYGREAKGDTKHNVVDLQPRCAAENNNVVVQ